MMETEATSTSLLSRLRRSDDDGWKRFTLLYSPLVYSWARQCQVDADTAGDITQDVFAAVHRNISGFERDKPGTTFRGWLWLITRNKVRDHFRNLARRPSSAGGSTANLMIQQIPDDEPATVSTRGGNHDSLLARALTLVQAEFEPKTWKAFWRTKIDEAPTALVAEELGMTSGAIRKARFRVLKRLREELQDLLQRSGTVP